MSTEQFQCFGFLVQVTLLHYQDVEGKESEEILKLAYLNCHFQVSYLSAPLTLISHLLFRSRPTHQ